MKSSFSLFTFSGAISGIVCWVLPAIFGASEAPFIWLVVAFLYGLATAFLANGYYLSLLREGVLGSFSWRFGFILTVVIAQTLVAYLVRLASTLI